MAHESFVLPPRAAFRLEPHGLDGWEVQRLSSYLVELAATERVRAQAILDKYVAWPTCVPDRPFGSCMRLNRVNGGGVLAERFVNAMGPLVGRSDLAALTLLPFRCVFGTAVGLIANKRRWCPRCLQRDVTKGAAPYERLIWAIDEVRCCPVHASPLSEACPRCSHSHASELSTRCTPGFCGRCNAWLGAPEVGSTGCALDAGQRSYDLWVARDFANLLALRGNLASALSYENVVAMLRRGVETVGEGSKEHFASMLQIDSQNVRNWMSGFHPPPARAMVRLSWTFGIGMRSWFLGDLHAWSSCSLANRVSSRTTRPRRSNRQDWSEIEHRLRASLDSRNPFPSFAAASRAVGYSPSYLRGRFPDLCTKITEAGRLMRHETTLARCDMREMNLRQAIEASICDLLDWKIYPSNQAVGGDLRKRGFSIQYRTFDIVAEIRNKLIE